MVKIFLDFDGTITKSDVGDELFETFGGSVCKSYVADYRRGLISALTCFRLESEACGKIDRRLLDNFILKQEIDPTIKDFLIFYRNNGFECYILSDGMDYYIEKILTHNGINHIPYFANHLDLVLTGHNDIVTFNPSFPFTDEDCDRCACCKRNIMLMNTADDDFIVYVGEGYSDQCPVRYADVVFAKDELLRFCREEKIPHSEYYTFADVLRILKEKTSKRNFAGKMKLKKRRQAQLARRDVFIGG